jgi:hypothetical protein
VPPPSSPFVVIVARCAFAIIVDFVSCRAAAIVVVSRCSIARRAVAVIVDFVAFVAPLPSSSSSSSIAHRAFAIIVDNGETSGHRRTKVAIDGVFFWLTDRDLRRWWRTDRDRR